MVPLSDWPIPSWPDKNRNRSPQRLVCRRSSPYPVPTCVSLSGMTLSEFRESLKAAEPPSGLGLALLGLWWDAKGDWARAHESAQQEEGTAGSWVHAYLHRKEGDASNASYWYSRAGRRPSVSGFEEEWKEITTALLVGGGE